MSDQTQLGERRSLRRREWVTLGLASFGVLHFSGSILHWSLYWYLGYRLRTNSGLETDFGVFLHAIPAVILLALFWFAVLHTIRRKPSGYTLVLIGIALSVATFVYDTHGRHWQWREMELGRGHVYHWLNWPSYEWVMGETQTSHWELLTLFVGVLAADLVAARLEARRLTTMNPSQ